jgi:hypothetical protein
MGMASAIDGRLTPFILALIVVGPENLCVQRPSNGCSTGAFLRYPPALPLPTPPPLPYQRLSALSGGAEVCLAGRFPDPSGIDGCCCGAGIFLGIGTLDILLRGLLAILLCLFLSPLSCLIGCPATRFSRPARALAQQ